MAGNGGEWSKTRRRDRSYPVLSDSPLPARVEPNTPCVHARACVHISMINRVKRPRSLQSVPPAATRKPCITVLERRRRRTSVRVLTFILSPSIHPRRPRATRSPAQQGGRLCYETIVPAQRNIGGPRDEKGVLLYRERALLPLSLSLSLSLFLPFRPCRDAIDPSSDRSKMIKTKNEN
jgi:hypothetical protein